MARPTVPVIEKREVIKTWRSNEDDQRVIAKLRKKLGIAESQIVRLAIRKLAEAEGLRVA